MQSGRLLHCCSCLWVILELRGTERHWLPGYMVLVLPKRAVNLGKPLPPEASVAALVKRGSAVGCCYGPKFVSPLQIHMLNPKAWCGGTGRSRGHEWVPCPYTRFEKAPLFCHVRTQQEVGTLRPARGFSKEPQHAGTLTLDFQPPEPGKINSRCL